MSDTKKMNVHLDGQNVGRLIRWLADAIDSGAIQAGDISQGMSIKFDTATGRYVGSSDGSNLVQLATIEDIAGTRAYRGQWDASTGIPTAAGSVIRPGEAIQAGDQWRVSVAGTISGMTGLETVEVGDLIYANADGAATAAQFWAVQGNINPAAGNMKSSTVTLASLPANTPTTVAPSGGDGLSSTLDVEIFDGNKKVTDGYDIDKSGATNVVLTSLVAKSNLTVVFIGA